MNLSIADSYRQAAGGKLQRNTSMFHTPKVSAKDQTARFEPRAVAQWLDFGILYTHRGFHGKMNLSRYCTGPRVCLCKRIISMRGAGASMASILLEK